MKGGILLSRPLFPDLPAPVAEAFAVLEQNGCAGYLVGGSVRDRLRGRQPADYDIAVSCEPQKTREIFSDYRCIETGLKHGTLTVVIGGMDLELTTFRKDCAYSDHRHPDEVLFTDDITADLARRDLTVNAMAYRPGEGLRDPFGGRADLRARLIRAVGDPACRFREDSLRILRALRFAAVLDFSVDEETAAAAVSLKGLLSYVSAERIFSELKKLLTGRGAGRILSAFRPVLETALPPLAGYTGAQYVAAAGAAGRMKDPAGAFAALLYFAGPADAEETCRALKTDHAFLKKVSFLCQNAPFTGDKGAALRLKGEVGSAFLCDLRAFCRAMEAPGEAVLTAALQSRLRCLRVRDLALNGRDLARMGFRGPGIGRAQTALLRAVTDGDCKNTPAALRRAAEAFENKEGSP